MKLNSTVKVFVDNELSRLNVSSKGLSLGIVQVGSDSASSSYIRGKLSDCEKYGINTVYIHESGKKWKNKRQVLNYIKEVYSENLLNMCTGVIVQLPLPFGITSEEVSEIILPSHDVDGFNPSSSVVPCTARGVVEFCNRVLFENDMSGVNAVVVGRSKTVGYPIAQQLLSKNASVSVFHSKSRDPDMRNAINRCDLVVTCTNVVEDEVLSGMVYNSSCDVVDVGLGKGKDGKLHGNITQNVVDLIDDSSKRRIVSGTGGVGLLTRMALIKNLVDLNK